MLKYNQDNELTKRALQEEVEINHYIDEDPSLSLPGNTGMDVNELESVPTEGAIVELTFQQPLPVEKVAE